MMNMQPKVLKSLIAACLGVLAACSGSVSVEISGPDISPDWVPWTDEPITAYGVNTGQTRIVVNNIGYTTNHATVTVNGRPGTAADIRQGQVITIRGDVYGGSFSGTADQVEYSAMLIGPVESIDATNSQLVVMGQTVITGPDTVFGSGIDPASYEGLSAGSNAEISGFARADGAIVATRIDRVAGSTELQLIGQVEDLDIANLIFEVNRLTVDYSNVLSIDLPGGGPSDGMIVRMTGYQSGGLFIAETLATAPDPVSATGRRVQVAGLVTRFHSTGNFYVNHLAAAANSGTEFRNGNVGDLAVDAELVIDGTVESGGRITADRVTFDRLVAGTATLSFAMSDFDEIAVSTVFGVTVTRGDEYRVEVQIDDDQQHRVFVTQEGSRLNILLGSGSGDIHTLHATITMPVLERFEAEGTIAVVLQGFEQEHMAIELAGVSVLEGRSMQIDRLTANVSGVSVLNLGNIRPLGYADIDVGGVSVATLNMIDQSTLSGSVGTGSGAAVSSLFYYGTNIDLDLTIGPLSAVRRLGPTRL